MAELIHLIKESFELSVKMRWLKENNLGVFYPINLCISNRSLLLTYKKLL